MPAIGARQGALEMTVKPTSGSMPVNGELQTSAATSAKETDDYRVNWFICGAPVCGLAAAAAARAADCCSRISRISTGTT